MAEQKLPKNLVIRDNMYAIRKKVQGVVRRRSTGVEATGRRADIERAERRMHEILKDWNDGKFGWNKKEAPAPPLGEYADRFMKTCSTGKADNSIVSYNLALSYWKTLYADRPLDTVKKMDCAAYMTWRLGGPRPDEEERREGDGPAGAANTVRHEMAVMHTVFEAAVDNDILAKNPMKGLKKPEAEIRSHTITKDEQGLLMDVLYPEYQRLATVYLGTGLRADELHQLEPHDVKFDVMQIHLPKEKAKGKKKGRKIPIFPEVERALREQMAARANNTTTDFMTKRSGRRINKTAIFNMSRPSALQAMHDGAAEAKIEEFTLHDLRRTFGTRSAEAGCPIKHLAMVMGHSDIAITAKYYIHIGDDNLQRTILALDLGLSVVKPTEKVANFEKKKKAEPKAPTGAAVTGVVTKVVTSAKRR